MILFQLQCSSGHRFEAWFRDGAAYDQRSKGQITCPACGDSEVVKAPMAPRIAKPRQDAAAERLSALQGELIGQLKELREVVEANFEHVGPRFAEEARRMHYGEADRRDIYGDATERETEELREEGIAVQRIPWVPNTNS